MCYCVKISILGGLGACPQEIRFSEIDFGVKIHINFNICEIKKFAINMIWRT